MMKKIVIINNTLKNYPRNKNIFEVLSKISDLEIIRLSKKYKPYTPKVFVNFFNIFHDVLFSKIPKDCKYVFILFGDVEHLWSVWLIKKIYGLDFKIVFDPLISYYDTYTYNKPLSSNLVIKKILENWLYFYEKALFKLPDIILIDTDANGDYINELLNLNIIFKKLLLCANNKVFCPTKLDDSNWWYNEPLKILWYGRISKLHGVDTILEAIDLIDDPKIKFTLVGDFDKYPKIKELISKNKVKYIKWKNPDDISLIDLSRLSQEHHIMLGAFGDTKTAEYVVINKEYEALASARCLITREGKKEFLKNNLNCIMIPPENSTALKNTILKLDKNRELLKRISINGYRDYISHCKNNYSKLLKSIIDS